MARQTKMILRIFLVVVVIVGFWYGVSRKSPSVSVEEPIKIGAILMLSGKTASYGERAHRGFVLALEDIAQSVPALEIEILYEDSGYDPKKGLSAYQKLRDINDVSVVITMSSSVSLAISSLVNQDKVLQMAIAASTPDYTSEGDFTFRTTARAEVEDKELAKAVASHYSKIALLYTNDERGIGHRDAITVAIEKLGGEIIIEETMLPEDNDFRTQLIKIKGQNPEAIYLLTDAKSGGMILKQAEELGINAQWFSTRSIQKKEFIEIAGEAAEGIIYTYGFNPESSRSAVKNFVAKYKARYGEIPDYVAAEAYDGLKLITKALGACGGLDVECMKQDLLATKNYPGLFGVLTFDKNGDVYYPYTLKTIKNGEFVPYED